MKALFHAVTAAVACAVQLLAGCAVPAESPPVVARCSTPLASSRPGPALVGQAYGMAMTPLPLNSVQFGSRAASTSLAVQDLFAERGPGNMVTVSARFLSCVDQPTSVRVRTSFMRANTAPAEEPTAWKVVFLEPHATAVYAESSVSQDAATYLIEIAK